MFWNKICYYKSNEIYNEYYYEIRLKSLDIFLNNFLSQYTEKTEDDNINIIDKKNELIDKFTKDIEDLKEQYKLKTIN